MNIIVKYTHNFLHFLHIPFRRLMSRQQFRYLACGGFMAVLDIVMYSVCFNTILHGQTVQILQWSCPAHVLALYMFFPVGFFISFLLSRYIVFSSTTVKKTTSLFRYILLVIACIILNITLIKFFVEICLLNAVLSKVFCTILVAAFSYVVQRYFAFSEKTVVPV